MKTERQIDDAGDGMADGDLLDDFSDLEAREGEDVHESLDDIETMLIDINEEPFAEKKRSIFETPEVRPKRKINVHQKPSNVIPISPKQFKDEARGAEDKLETALSNLKFKDEEKATNEVKPPAKKVETDEERQKRFQELRDMLQRINQEEREAAEEEAKEEAIRAENEAEAPKEAELEKVEPEKTEPEEAGVETLEKAELEEPEPKAGKSKRKTIAIDAFGSPAHKAGELFKSVTAEFKNEVSGALRAGVLKFLENGRFDFDKATLLRAGLEAKLDARLYDIYDFSDKGIKESLESEAEVKKQILTELTERELSKISDKDFEAEKRAGILSAVMLGGYEDVMRGETIYSLPVEQLAALKSLFFENKIRLDDKNTMRASLAGFISILELEKENDEISTESLRVLDWYYENFHYRKYYTDFVKTMNFYIDINDYDFERTALKFAYHRQKFQEQVVFKELTVGDDTATIAKMAEAKPITYEKLKKILDEYKEKNNFGEYAAQLKAAAIRGKAFRKLKEIYNFEAGTYLKAVKEIRRIRELDTYASFFLAEAEVLAVDSGLMVVNQYILVRFGFNGYNNVVVLKLMDGVQPVVAWRGKTGDDSDGFREYFKRAENEMKRHKMMKILDGKFNHEILNSELKWQKVWDFLNWPD